MQFKKKEKRKEQNDVREKWQDEASDKQRK